jgi:hypothetical protein
MSALREEVVVGLDTLLDAQDAKMLPELQLPHVPTREQIVRLQTEMMKLPQVPIEPVHYFAHGLYAREITIPAGTLLTGKVHKTEHLNILSKGRITVWTEDGMKTLSAPFTLTSRPGTKRVGLAHTETVWTTIHATHERDIEALERELIEDEALELRQPDWPALENAS